MSELTLTIYPRHPRTPGPGKGWADWRRDQDRECKMAHDKRFSDAELAAELWAEMTEEVRTSAQVLYEKTALQNPYIRSHFREVSDRRETLHRFARAPHYYEETE